MRYVLIGTGNISTTYVSVLEKVDGAHLVGCVSRTGRRLPAAPSVPSSTTLAGMTEPFDAVIVTTPNAFHHSAAIEAARLGKHVLVEKPLGISSQGMSEAIDACRSANVTLAVSYQRRAAPDNRAIRALLEKNAFGRVFAADLSAKFWRDQAYYDSADYRGTRLIDGGGVFVQQACHNIDLYVWFFGMPQDVTSLLGTFAHRMEGEDHGAVLMRYDNGMIGTIVASTAAYPGFPARLDVHTEKGTFSMTDDRITVWEIDGIPNPASPAPAYKHDGARSAAVTDTSLHEEIVRDFEAAVRDGREPLVSGESARRASELILMVYGKK